MSAARKYLMLVESGLICEVVCEEKEFIVVKLYNYGAARYSKDDLVRKEIRDLVRAGAGRCGVWAGEWNDAISRLKPWDHLDGDEGLHWINVSDYDGRKVIRMEVCNEHNISQVGPYLRANFVKEFREFDPEAARVHRATTYSANVNDDEIWAASKMRMEFSRLDKDYNTSMAEVLMTDFKAMLDYEQVMKMSLGFKEEKLRYAMIFSMLLTPRSIKRKLGVEIVIGSAAEEGPEDNGRRRQRVIRHGDGLAVSGMNTHDVWALVILCTGASIAYLAARWGRANPEEVIQVAILLALTSTLTLVKAYLGLMKGGWSISDVVSRIRPITSEIVPPEFYEHGAEAFIEDMLISGSWRDMFFSDGTCVFHGGEGSGKYRLSRNLDFQELKKMGFNLAMTKKGTIVVGSDKHHVPYRTLERKDDSKYHAAGLNPVARLKTVMYGLDEQETDSGRSRLIQGVMAPASMSAQLSVCGSVSGRDDRQEKMNKV
jgi:hypothetical protein